MRLPRLMRTSTSFTLIHRAFMSPSDGFSKGAKTTAEVGLTAGLINMSRGGGYECDEYCHIIVHDMTLNMYLLLI
jgi:hypothetical protein